MFHVNAWGLPHSGILMGSKLVFPGRFLTPASIAHLMEAERVTVAAGVPTIWIGVLATLRKEDIDLSALRAIYSGGAAVPQALIEGLAAKGVNIVQAWGMTETSPVAATCNLRSYQLVLPREEQFRIKARQGTVWPCVDFRAVDLETGKEVHWDDHSYGELLVRGPWVARAYLGDSGSNEKFADGGLHTGDVVMIDEDGML